MNKLDDYYLVDCFLINQSWTEIWPDKGIVQSVYIQRIRYLVDYAFNYDKDNTFGVGDAYVTLTLGNQKYILTGNGLGAYICETDTIKPGTLCSLYVELTNGLEFRSSMITPDITLQDKDTIWIMPDSINGFAAVGDEVPWPRETIGPHYCDTINYSCTEGSFLIDPQPRQTWPNWTELPHLWIRYDTLGNNVLVYTATDSPSIFSAITDTADFQMEVGFAIKHIYQYYHEKYLNYSDPVDITLEELKSISNIQGAFGFFTTDSRKIHKKYHIRLRK